MGDLSAPDLPDWYLEDQEEDGSGGDASSNTTPSRPRKRRKEIVNEVGVVFRSVSCDYHVQVPGGGDRMQGLLWKQLRWRLYD